MWLACERKFAREKRHPGRARLRLARGPRGGREGQGEILRRGRSRHLTNRNEKSAGIHKHGHCDGHAIAADSPRAGILDQRRELRGESGKAAYDALKAFIGWEKRAEGRRVGPSNRER